MKSEREISRYINDDITTDKIYSLKDTVTAGYNGIEFASSPPSLRLFPYS